MMNTTFLYALLSTIVYVAGIASVADAAAVAIAVKAPMSKENVYDEIIPMFHASNVVYRFGEMVKAAREAKIELKLPEGFPLDGLSIFANESVDLRHLNNGNGLSFTEMYRVINLNEDALKNIYDKEQQKLLLKMIDDVKEFKKYINKADENDSNAFYLATFRSIQAKVSCVYGVIKDEHNKRITVTFRGSQNPDFTTHDWRTNFSAFLVKLDTPGLIKDKMKGKMKKSILVHKGFYDYLFNNKKIAGEQRYDKILEDIKPLMEEGYSIYVTGHSLGGALATMFSLELAGDRRNSHWIPKPVTAITFAAPFSGASGYRTAFEQTEKDGLIRSLRVNNDQDFIPTLPPFSLGWTRRTMKHVGINLRLSDKGFTTVHSSNGGFFTAFKNSIVKPVWSALKYHSLSLHDSRIDKHSEDLKALTIDGMYRDDKVVSEEFIKTTGK